MNIAYVRQQVNNNILHPYDGVRVKFVDGEQHKKFSTQWTDDQNNWVNVKINLM